ncbi:hypothetical protein [Hymenobacter sp. YC55]|uniref:hypothetical protein n=1 Tax=Hymenobacter sp. YC55 TaxID=3034019 RepID=UPI0023F98098|nr:hypothetical protein [Hymenobacter sp. YC55]MDF7814364.1 hypothetical protein [Hymenobacter sp. YC55]
MRLFALTVVLLLAGFTASAQTTEPNHRAANRRALRDARKYPAPYKDSHLAVDKAALKRGDGGRAATPNDGRQKYKFDKTGTARVSEPSTISLRLRNKKTKTTGN